MLDSYFDLSHAERMPYAIVGAIVLGLIFGYFVSRESHKRQPLFGGTFAHIFHYLAASTVTAVLPWVILGLLSGFHILRLIAVGLCFALANAVFLTSYGFFESKAERVEVKPVRLLD